MTRTPDDHVLAAEEGELSPAVVLATLALVGLFGLAVLYRAGLAII